MAAKKTDDAGGVLEQARGRADSVGVALRAYLTDGQRKRKERGLEHQRWSAVLSAQYVNHCILTALAAADREAGSFVLKGGNLWLVWQDDYLRPTDDLDLGSNLERDRFVDAFRQAVESEAFRRETGIVIDVRPEMISGIEKQAFDGVRIEGQARFGTADVPFCVETTFTADPACGVRLSELAPFAARVAEFKTVDRLREIGLDEARIVAFAADHAPLSVRLAGLRSEADARGDARTADKLDRLAEWCGPYADPIRIMTAAPEYMYSEKLHSLAVRGPANTRLKDAYDLMMLTQLALDASKRRGPAFSFDPAVAQECIVFVFGTQFNQTHLIPRSVEALRQRLSDWAQATDSHGVRNAMIWEKRRMPEWNGRPFAPGRDPSMADAVSIVVDGVARLGVLPGMTPAAPVHGHGALAPVALSASPAAASDMPLEAAIVAAADVSAALPEIDPADLERLRTLCAELTGQLPQDAAGAAAVLADGKKALGLANLAKAVIGQAEQLKAVAGQQSEEGKAVYAIAAAAATIGKAAKAVHVADPKTGAKMPADAAARMAVGGVTKLVGPTALGRLPVPEPAAVGMSGPR